MRKLNRLTMTLALLIMAVGGAWAGEEPQLLTTINASSSFLTGSQTFDDKVTVTFSNPVYYDGEEGWYAGSQSLLTVAGTNGYTITSCKFYTGYGTAQTGYTVEGESPSVCLSGGFVYTDANQSVTMGYEGVTKIEVYGAAEPTEWELKPDADKKVWTLAEMPASNIELQVEYEPTKVTMAVNDNAMGTVEVAGQSKVEWTADTWEGWTFNTKEYTVDDITMTSSQNAYVQDYPKEGKYLHSLSFFVAETENSSTVTFSTTGDPFSRIEFTMLDDYEADWNPNIKPNDNWTFKGKSAVWEGEATKSLTLQSCSTEVSKITFFKGDIPDGVTVNTDGTFTVAKTATVTLKATPAEGYKFLYWEDDQTNTNPVREVTIESGLADKTYKAVFAEITYNVTFVEGTDLNEWSATPNTEVKKDTKVDIKYTGTKKVIGVKVEKKEAAAMPTLAEATAEDVGKIAGADGNIYDTKADAEAAGTTAVAMIAYVGTESDCAHGLAIALADESDKKNYGAAGPACSGKAAVTGGTWRLPSIKDWQYMLIGCGASESYKDNPGAMSYSGLASKLTTAQGNALVQGVSYWSSTGYSADYSWRMYINGSNVNFTLDYKGNDLQVRACFAF